MVTLAHKTLKIFKKLKINHKEVDVDKAIEMSTNESLDELPLGEYSYDNKAEDCDGVNNDANNMLLRLPGVTVQNARKITSECDSRSFKILSGLVKPTFRISLKFL